MRSSDGSSRPMRHGAFPPHLRHSAEWISFAVGRGRRRGSRPWERASTARSDPCQTWPAARLLTLCRLPVSGPQLRSPRVGPYVTKANSVKGDSRWTFSISAATSHWPERR